MVGGLAGGSNLPDTVPLLRPSRRALRKNDRQRNHGPSCGKSRWKVIGLSEQFDPEHQQALLGPTPDRRSCWTGDPWRDESKVERPLRGHKGRGKDANDNSLLRPSTIPA